MNTSDYAGKIEWIADGIVRVCECEAEHLFFSATRKNARHKSDRKNGKNSRITVWALGTWKAPAVLPIPILSHAGFCVFVSIQRIVVNRSIRFTFSAVNLPWTEHCLKRMPATKIIFHLVPLFRPCYRIPFIIRRRIEFVLVFSSTGKMFFMFRIIVYLLFYMSARFASCTTERQC